MKAAAYIRKSTSGTDENGIERQEGSFARQHAAITDYAKRQSIEIVRWYEEPVSGKSIRKRKIFLQMVKDAKNPLREFQCIIFGEYDRFMRDVKEAMRYEVDLDDAGIELHFTNLRNDGSSGDEIYKSVARQMAAEYSRELARKVVQGMVRKAKMGSWLGGVPPYGYRTMKNQNGTVSLQVHTEEAKVVETIFKLSLKGWGHKKIATWLNDQGISTGQAAQVRSSLSNKNPDGKWSGETVRGMLRNVVYKGLYRWNKKARVDCFDWKVEDRGTVEIGKLRTQLPAFKNNGSFYTDRNKDADAWISKEGNVPTIIPPEIFDQVQDRFNPYSSRKWRGGNSAKYFMSGFFRCKNCGNGMSGHRYSKIVKQTGKRAFYKYYRCTGDVKKGRHGKIARPMMKMDVVDRAVEEGILRRASAFVDAGRVRDLFKRKVAAFVESKPNRLAQVEKEMRRIEQEISRIIEAYTKFERPLPEDKVMDLKVKKGNLEEERKRLLSSGENYLFNFEYEADRFLSRANRIDGILKSGDLFERHRLRDCFLKKAEVNWLAPNGDAEVELQWFKVPQLIGVDGSLERGTVAPPPPF